MWYKRRREFDDRGRLHMPDQLMYIAVTLPGGFVCLVIAFVLLQHALTSLRACDFARCLYGISSVTCLVLSYLAANALTWLLKASHDWRFVVTLVFALLSLAWLALGWHMWRYYLHPARRRANALAGRRRLQRAQDRRARHDHRVATRRKPKTSRSGG